MSDEKLTIIEFASYLECLSDSEFTKKMHKCFSDTHFDLTDKEIIKAIIDRAQKVSILLQSQKSFSPDNVADWLLNGKPLPDHASGSVQDTDM
jgi:hypothetical protein